MRFCNKNRKVKRTPTARLKSAQDDWEDYKSKYLTKKDVQETLPPPPPPSDPDQSFLDNQKHQSKLRQNPSIINKRDESNADIKMST